MQVFLINVLYYCDRNVRESIYIMQLKTFRQIFIFFFGRILPENLVNILSFHNVLIFWSTVIIDINTKKSYLKTKYKVDYNVKVWYTKKSVHSSVPLKHLIIAIHFNLAPEKDSDAINLNNYQKKTTVVVQTTTNTQDQIIVNNANMYLSVDRRLDQITYSDLHGNYGGSHGQKLYETFRPIFCIILETIDPLSRPSKTAIFGQFFYLTASDFERKETFNSFQNNHLISVWDTASQLQH